MSSMFYDIYHLNVLTYCMARAVKYLSSNLTGVIFNIKQCHLTTFLVKKLHLINSNGSMFFFINSVILNVSLCGCPLVICGVLLVRCNKM